MLFLLHVGITRVHKIALLLLIVFVHTSVFAQRIDGDLGNLSKLIEVIPPSPNAASLGKYGDIDVSLSSGMANVAIPIYSYQSSNLTLPVSLSYSSNGFRVDEIASRVGNGWILNAGGVITRTVYGQIDESSQRLKPPTGFPEPTKATLDYLHTLASDDANNFDSEQDLFSFNFNGYSGKFILDDSMHPVLLTHSNIKIENDFNSSDWNFRIISGDGIQYFFGGEAREITNKSQTGAGCGKIYRNAAVTSWYLKKIIHPNRDTVNLFYDPVRMSYYTGISQSAFYKVFNPGGCTTCPSYQNTTCVTSLTTDGVLLREIKSSGGARVRFFYTGRSDLNDSLLARIEIYRPDGSVARVFNLEYTQAVANGFSNSYQTKNELFYRPFLTKFIERSADSVQVKTHMFQYNNISNLPPRLAFAQDHYGYFNGRNNNTLLTTSKDDWLSEYLPQANADREPDPEYSSRGMLAKVIYPTGGEDTLIYEGNTTYEEVAIPPPTGILVADAYSSDVSGGMQVANSDTVLISEDQHVTIYASASSDGDDPIHNRGTVSIIKLPSGTAVFSRSVTPTEPLSATIPLGKGISYYMQVRASGVQTQVSSTLRYLDGPVTYTYKNMPAAGIRIKKTISRSKSSPDVVRRYYYNSLADTARSSAVYLFRTTYFKPLTTKIGCDPTTCSYTSCQYYALYSNTQQNLYVYGGSPVMYRTVVEGVGENFEGGGIEHTYTVANDIPGNNLMGDNIASAPFTSYSWKNGREVYQFIFKKNGSVNVPVQETFTHFKEDSRVDSEYVSYVVNEKYVRDCQSDPPSQNEIEAFDLLSYSHFKNWSYVDSVKTRTYDDTGSAYMERLEITEYGNVSHAMPTSITSTSSDNKVEVVKNFYPADLAFNGGEESARQTLIAQNIITPVLLKQFVRDNTNIAQSKTGYTITPENLVLPQTQSTQTGNNIMEKRVEFHKYNAAGKLLEQSKSGDVHQVFLWGYRSLYPVARIVGTDYATASSFVNMNILNSPSSDQQLRMELDKIRVGLAGKNALVSSYTYSPLVGITSETDPSGKTTYYEYDGLGRLKVIKDKDGKVLKVFDYQYSIPITR